MMKRMVSAALFALFLFFAPLATVFAAEQQTPETSLAEGPFVILAFATIILMIYYAFRD